VLLPWRLVPLVLVVLVFIAGFILDPEAVMRLVWACVSGAFGRRVQIAGGAILLGVVAVTVWAFRPLAPSGPVRQAKAARRPSGRAPSRKGDPGR
jgi:hypothetical protein